MECVCKLFDRGCNLKIRYLMFGFVWFLDFFYLFDFVDRFLELCNLMCFFGKERKWEVKIK